MIKDIDKYNLILITACLISFGFFIQPTKVLAENNQSAHEIIGNYVFNNDLELGDSSDDVLALQKLLIKGGYLKITRPSPKYGYGPNGYYGEQTKASVIKWQKDRGISPASGVFGPISRAKANLGYILIPSRGDEEDVSTNNSVTLNHAGSTVVSNKNIITSNSCVYWTYTDWSACSAWGNQTRSIIASWPVGCAGGNFILEQSCATANTSNTTDNSATNVFEGASVGTYRPTGQFTQTLDDRLISAAFLDNGRNVGLTCKPWVSKVVGLATNNMLALPTTRDDNYTWNSSSDNRVITKNCSIENVSRGDIVQMKMSKNDWPHTAIVAASTPTGMVWIHSNWQSKKTVSVDFIAYAYFKNTFGQDYSVYHLQ